jgi:hypothetical protein
MGGGEISIGCPNGLGGFIIVCVRLPKLASQRFSISSWVVAFISKSPAQNRAYRDRLRTESQQRTRQRRTNEGNPAPWQVKIGDTFNVDVSRPCQAPVLHPQFANKCLEGCMFAIRSGNFQISLMLATAVAVLVLQTAAEAYTPEGQQACTGDAFRLCSAEIPNVDRVRACLHRNKAQLSPGCRGFISAGAHRPAAGGR